MKERIVRLETLTNISQKKYPRTGGNFMSDEVRNEDISQSGASRRIEEAVKRGETGRSPAKSEKKSQQEEIEKTEQQARKNNSTEENKNDQPDESDGGERGVKGPSEKSLGKDLEGIADTSFPEIQNFLKKISEIPIGTREQLEEIHRLFGSSSNEVLSRVGSEFIKKDNELLKEYSEKKPATDKEAKELQKELDAKRDAVRKNHLEEREKLRKIHENFLNVLESKYGSGRRGLTADQQTLLNSIKILEDKASEENVTEDQKKELKSELRERVIVLSDTVAPQDEPLPDEILIAIGKDAFASEKFLDKVIRLKQEDAQYHLPGFYSDINVNKFLRLNESLMEEKTMEHIKNLLRGTETLHEMNRILKTSLDQFAQIGQTILPEHLTTIFKLPGVEDVFELYEGIIKENLSIETMITEDVFKMIDVQVSKEFRAGVNNQVLKNGEKVGDNLTKSYKGEGQMENWEVERAIVYGRNLMRTLLREGEYISFSHIPEAQRAFISLAQGQLIGVLNPVTYTLNRFKPGESQGGIELLKEVLRKTAEKRRSERNGESSKGIVRIKELQGTSVSDREATKLINARGAIMTWRATEAILREFAIIDNGRVSNIAQFFGDHEKEISILKEISSSNAWKREFERTKGVVSDDVSKSSKLYDNLEDWKRARIDQVFGSLLENSAVGQGILVSNVLPIPTEVKEMLWERISALNPDVMASLLTRLEVDNKAEGFEDIKDVKSVEEIVLQNFGDDRQKEILLGIDGSWRPRVLKQELDRLSSETIVKLEVKLQNAKNETEKDNLRAELAKVAPDYDVKKREFDTLNNEVKSLLRNEKWAALRMKLRTINRLRMRDETERIEKIKTLNKDVPITEKIAPPKKIIDYFRDERLSSESRLSSEEIKVVDEISKNGRKIIRDLSNIQQANIWFLDDVPTSNIKWENLGQSFNRMIGDFGQFSQAANELNAFLVDPFKMKAEKVTEHLSKAILSAGQVLGIEPAQDNLNGIVMEYNRWIETYPRFRQKIVNMIATAQEKYTSKAQEVSRDTGALSLDEENVYKHLLEQNHASILRGEKRDENGKIIHKDLFKAAVKELKVDVMRRFVWASIRDYGPFFLIGIILSFFKETASRKK